MKLRHSLSLAALLLWVGSASAAVDTATLDKVYVEPPRAGTALPLSLTFHDENDRPLPLSQAFDAPAVVLVFADYTCHTLCGPILDFTTSALQQTGLRAGADYRLVVIGLDPKDAIDTARGMKQSHLGDGGPIARSAAFLTGTAAAIAQATTALGYHYAYDSEHDQFAHPAAAFVLTRTGKVTRVLSGLGLNGTDMHLALLEAGQGQVGTLADRFRLLCYGYDPSRGIYTTRIVFLLELSGALTLAVMAVGILVMHRMTRATS